MAIRFILGFVILFQQNNVKNIFKKKLKNGVILAIFA